MSQPEDPTAELASIAAAAAALARRAGAQRGRHRVVPPPAPAPRPAAPGPSVPGPAVPGPAGPDRAAAAGEPPTKTLTARGTAPETTSVAPGPAGPGAGPESGSAAPSPVDRATAQPARDADPAETPTERRAFPTFGDSAPRRPAAAAPQVPPAANTAADSARGPRPADLAPGIGSLEALESAVKSCRACTLCDSRTQTVFGDGRGTRRILFVGEAPGADEDASGVPFVGAAGKLLTDIITKGMGLAREDVYIANVLKCRPPGNRDPRPDEKALCTAWLDRQIELLDPAVIIPLGRHAASHLLDQDVPLGRLRGKVHEHRGRKIVPTYHPAYLLRSPAEKKKTWEDIQLAMAAADIPLPKKG